LNATVTTGLERLFDAIRAALGDGDGSVAHWEQAPVAAGLDAALRDALGDPDLLPAPVIATPRFGFGTCLLHTEAAFTLFASVTAPDAPTPIHDHGSWGMVGLFRGVEEEIRFDRVPPAEGQAWSGLVETSRATVHQGEVVVVGPPPADVHRVVNLGRESSVGIHLFRHDLVAQGFVIYEEPGHRPVPTGSIAYDAVLGAGH